MAIWVMKCVTYLTETSAGVMVFVVQRPHSFKERN